MDVPDAASPRTGGERLRRHWLVLARVTWFALVALTIGLTTASIIATIAERQRQVGVVGADVTWNEASQAVLWTWPGSAAARVGIHPGDILDAIDGSTVLAGQPIATTRTLLEGRIGTDVTLRTLGSDGVERQFTLTRYEDEMSQATVRLGLSTQITNVYFTALEVILILAFLSIGVVIFWRRPNGLLWYISLTLVLAAPSFSYTYFLLWQVHPEWGLPIRLLPAMAVSAMLPGFYVLPDGRFIPRWTIPLAIGWIVWTFEQEFFPIAAISLSGWLDTLVHFAWYGTGIFAQAYRFQRVSSPIQRQQTKWVVFGLSVAVLGYYGWALAQNVFPEVAVPGLAKLLFWLVGRPIYVACLVLVPISFGVAVVRYRLWDIDILINRTLVYGLLTASLALIYFGGVGVTERVLRALTGQESDLAIVGSTLAIAALVSPLRRFLQTGIDRRFYRKKYDAARVLATVSATVRDEVDLTRLGQVLVEAIDDAMQPAHVSLWLRQPAAGSFRITSATASSLTPPNIAAQRVR